MAVCAMCTHRTTLYSRFHFCVFSRKQLTCFSLHDIEQWDKHLGDPSLFRPFIQCVHAAHTTHCRSLGSYWVIKLIVSVRVIQWGVRGPSDSDLTLHHHATPVTFSL